MIETGPGVIRIDHRAHRSGNLEWFHLDNFDIDGVTVKPRHRSYLSDRFANNFLPTTRSTDLLIPADDIWIFLRGYASRTGGTDHNIDLSIQRVDNVRDYLVGSCHISDNKITGLDYVGEEWSHGEIEEDEIFRSVEVIASHENRPPPPSPPPAIVDRFRMRAKPVGAEVLGAIADELEIPGGLGGTLLMIQIQNRTSRDTRTYVYISAQVTAGLSVPLPASPSGTRDRPSRGSGYGNWVNFTTRSNHHVVFSDFEGSASFGGMVGVQIGSYSAGDNYFQFSSDQLRDVERWVTVRPRTITLPMPDSMGLGFSLISMSAFGRLILWD
ncbi:MAG: hypothetical protein WBP16_02435 [Ferruginibacter sp.]